MDAFLQQQVIRSTADFIVIAAPILGSLYVMHRENRELQRTMDARWADSIKGLAKVNDKIAEESKERHRQFYELLRKLDERQRTNS